jgi:hypothetical protein
MNRCDRNPESGQLSGRRERDFEACRPAHTAPADCSHQNGKATPTARPNPLQMHECLYLVPPTGFGLEADQYANGLH